MQYDDTSTYENDMEQLLLNNPFHSKMVEFLKEKEELKEEFNNFVDDKSFSLDERWQVYVTYAEEFYPEPENFIIHLDSFNVGEYYRDSIEGRGTIVDLLTNIKDINWEFNEIGTKFLDKEWHSQEKIDSVREEIIKNKYTKFTYDW